MNKIEIINDVMSAYSQDNRAYNEEMEKCMYLAPNEQRCALGRYSISPELDTFEGDADEVFKYLADGDKESFDAMLKPEVRGHEIEFWCDLQTLHDDKNFWNFAGLSNTGDRYADLLKRYWRNK